jgi:integrase/recombinase XerC
MPVIREPALLEPLFQDFLTYCRASNRSPNTIRAYQSDLASFLALAGKEATTAQINRKLIRSFVTVLYESGVKVSSMRRKIAAVKSFVGWLESEDLIKAGTADLIPKPRSRDQLPDVPSETEVHRLVSGEFQTACPERDRVVVELLYGSGLRADELVGINLDDFGDPDLLLVRGKGRKERLVFVGEYGRLAIMYWLPVRKRMLQRQLLETPALLCSVSPRGSVERLDVRSVGRIVKDVAQAHGLDPKKWHPHLLRHACATHMHDNGAPLQAIATLLGHSKLTTAQIYTRVSVGRMMRTFKQAHPHAS